jgi:acetyl esterase/lipase
VKPIAFLLVLLVGVTTGVAQTVNVWPGVAPGSERWTQQERVIENTPVGTVILNVVTSTLTAYLPAKTQATGTSVIIAPGGAFVAIAISLEGDTVVRWLQHKGIAAFVLKYRVVEKTTEGIPRPSFAALVYGAPFGKMPAIPAKLPPVFMAWAQDDPVAREFVVKFQDALTKAGNAPEVHIFSNGGMGSDSNGRARAAITGSRRSITG